MPDHGRLGLGQVGHKSPQVPGRDARDLLRPFRGIVCDELLQGRKAIHILFDIFGVVEFLGDEFIDHGQIEGVVSARTELEIPVGLARGDGRPDIDDRQLAPVVQGVEEVVDLGHIDGFEDVAGLQHDVPGVAEVVDEISASASGHGFGGMVHIARAGHVVIAVVDGPDAMHEGLVQIDEGAGTIGPQHRVGAVLCDDVLQLFGHIGESLVPTDLAPLALAPFTCTDQGLTDAVRILEQTHPRPAAGAKRSLERRMGIALDETNLVVLDLDLNGTTDRAHAANAVNLCGCHA